MQKNILKGKDLLRSFVIYFAISKFYKIIDETWKAKMIQKKKKLLFLIKADKKLNKNKRADILY